MVWKPVWRWRRIAANVSGRVGCQRGAYAGVGNSISVYSQGHNETCARGAPAVDARGSCAGGKTLDTICHWRIWRGHVCAICECVVEDDAECFGRDDWYYLCDF